MRGGSVVPADTSERSRPIALDVRSDELITLSVLGPVRAWRGDVEIDLGPPQQRAILALLLVIYCPRIPGLARVPGPLAAMVIVTGIQAAFHFDGVPTIASTFGGIPTRRIVSK